MQSQEQKRPPEAGKSKFSTQYSIVEVIKASKTSTSLQYRIEKTSIVRDNKNNYYIAKKIYMNDDKALNEIGMMKNVKHPNIVAFHDLIVEKEHIYLVEEFCEEGDLSFHIRRQIRKKRTYFTEELISQWLIQLLLAIQYLHNAKIMHRDICPKNIFLTSRGNLKLGSFRLSKIFDGERDLAITVIRSPYYMAPQCVQQKAYDYKIDLWAFGCVLYELCSLVPIYNTKNMVQLANNIMRGKTEEIPSCYTKSLNLILQKCMTKKSYERPSAKDLLRTQYFLDAMKHFISQKQTIINRIPIKRYKVHNQILQKKKKEPKKFTPRLSKQKQKIKLIQQPQSTALPKINQVQSTKIHRKSLSKELRKDNSAIKARDESKQKLKMVQQRLRERIGSRSRQNYRMSSRQRQQGQNDSCEKKQCFISIGNPYSSKQKQRKVAVNSSRQKKKNDQQLRVITKHTSTQMIKNGQQSPNLIRKSEVNSREKNRNNSGKKIQTVKTEQSFENSPGPATRLLPPPMLPRPPQKKMEKSGEQKLLDFSETRKKQDLQKQLHMFRVSEDTQQVKDRLSKIFDDLNIHEDDEQQFSFDLEDQNLARLTIKQDGDAGQLINTYKTKLAQLIEEINYKYCPNMETIQQKTQQFDSNTFAQKLPYI